MRIGGLQLPGVHELAAVPGLVEQLDSVEQGSVVRQGARLTTQSAFGSQCPK